MLDTKAGSLVIKRLLPEYQYAIPVALDYCEAAYQRRTRFDRQMRLDDETLYCTELIEKAFRCAGLVLSEPIKIRCVPKYGRYSWLRPLAERYYGFSVDRPVFAPGNQHYGTYSCPYLVTVYDATYCGRPEKDRKPPRCPPCPIGLGCFSCPSAPACPAPE